MSDLQRAFAKAKLSSFPATIPPAAPFIEADEEEESEETGYFNIEAADLHHDDDSSSASSASSASSTGTIIPSQNQKLFARPQGYPPILPIQY